MNHCTQRSAFGAPLVRQPLMQNVLADLAVEAEAGLLSAMRLSLAFDEGCARPAHNPWLGYAYLCCLWQRDEPRGENVRAGGGRREQVLAVQARAAGGGGGHGVLWCAAYLQLRLPAAVPLLTAVAWQAAVATWRARACRARSASLH